MGPLRKTKSTSGQGAVAIVVRGGGTRGVRIDPITGHVYRDGVLVAFGPTK
jgi:hypothetical protein